MYNLVVIQVCSLNYKEEVSVASTYSSAILGLLSSFLYSLLLMSINATDLCMLIVYPVALLNLCIVIFLVEILGFSIYKITSYAHREPYFFLSISYVFYFFLLLDFSGKDFQDYVE